MTVTYLIDMLVKYYNSFVDNVTRYCTHQIIYQNLTVQTEQKLLFFFFFSIDKSRETEITRDKKQPGHLNMHGKKTVFTFKIKSMLIVLQL